MNNKTFYIESLGCISNLSDTNRVQKYMRVNGWKQVKEPSQAYVIILMTCAFTKFAEDLNIKRLNELQNKKSSEASIIVGGCLPAINKERLKREFKGLTFTPRQLNKLDSFFPSNVSINNISPVCDDPDSIEVKAIRISTGCLNNCTYCSIPFANGRVSSRDINSIIDDIKNCIDAGNNNVKLVSEDLGAYGQDKKISIIDLLSKIIEIDEDFSLYLDNFNPNWLFKYKNEVISLLRNEKFAKSLYIPIQSGSDRILDLMKREYKIQHVFDILESLNNNFDNISINTDFIVGFPTESELDFNDTKTILKNFKFNHVEIFAYEERPNTPALKLFPKIPKEIIAERQEELITIHISKYLNTNKINNIARLRENLESKNTLPINFNFIIN